MIEGRRETGESLSPSPSSFCQFFAMIQTMSQNNFLIDSKSIHFIGIGGIGISAIAKMLLLEGKKVSGSDRDETKVTEELRRAGAMVSIGHDAKNIPADCDLVVYTVAISENNPELVEAKKRGIALLTYPQTLSIISKEKYTIAVSGTHGKTTTTAMVAKVLKDAGLDPTVIVGSLLKNDIDGKTESNFIMGKSKYLVVEADEYKKSFHNLEPSIMVITNIDEDHLDFYKDLADIQNSFLHLAQKLPADGFLICDTSLPNLQPVIKGVKCQVIDYSQIKLLEKLLVPGEHNRQDARAAIAVGQAIGVDLVKANKSVAQFAGTWRRFEYKGKTSAGAHVYDDYAHNPQKVRAAIAGARELYPENRIIIVFQPHLFSRTKLLLNEFAKSFHDANEVMLAPIFPAREAFDPTISSEILAKEIIKNDYDSPVQAFPDFESIISHLKSTLKKDDVLITMGAGEQYKIGDALLA